MDKVIPAIEVVTKRSAIVLALVGLALLGPPGHCFAQDPATAPQDAEQSRTIDTMGISSWLSVRFSQSELQGLRPGELRVESHYCSCYDQPRKHFPYAMVVVNTPKGDWIARPEGGEDGVRFTALAVRFGDLYCDVEVEGNCYGSFSHPCEFSDFRYGPHLQAFFPTCKTDESEIAALVPFASENFWP